MATADPAEGDEKLIAAAHQIVSSLATSKTSADDMIRILSGFDHRLSSMSDVSHDAAAEDGGGDDDSSEADDRLDAAERVIHKWDSSPASLLWDSSPDVAAEYLAAVDGVIPLASSASSASDDAVSRRAENALQSAMSRLEAEFCHLMIRHTAPLDADDLYGSVRRASLAPYAPDGDPVADEFDAPAEEVSAHRHRRGGSAIGDDRVVDLIEPDVVYDLKEIADRMVRSGYDKELCQAYSSVRRDILDESLSILGVDRLNIEEVQRMDWSTLNDAMKRWIQAVKVCTRVLLPGEKQLCDEILSSSEDQELRQHCFNGSAKASVMLLLNFADAVSICERSSEKLFRVLDMYEALAAALPELRSLFDGPTGELICDEVDEILGRLGSAVKGIISEFGNAVRSEKSRRPVQGAEIHPLTRYVMNYLKLLVDYTDSLELLLDNDLHIHLDGEETDSQYAGSLTPLGQKLQLLISYLEANLEEKSKLYEDIGMQYIFLMNNILYIFQKVKDSELRRFLGDHWIRKRQGKVRQLDTKYLRASWTKLLSYLKDDGLGGSGGSSHSSSKMAMAIKERFKNFNMGFEEIYRVQTTWKVPDPQLREELRISISENVIPAYRSFMGRFSGLLEGGRNAAKYLKYTPEDLENNLSDLFEGLPGLSNHPRRRS